MIVTISHNYYVVIFDLCSSSVILEDLQGQGKLPVWKKLWEDIFRYLEKQSKNGEKYTIYKFVGDGFILLYNPAFENYLVSTCYRISEYINKQVVNIIDQFLNIQPERVGITVGIDKGNLIEIAINNNKEYTGKAINVASRLQSSLKKPENTNKMLVSKIVRNSVFEQYESRIYRQVERTLSNLYGNKPVYCYEVDLSVNPNEYLIEET
jgi:hypothetical protein